MKANKDAPVAVNFSVHFLSVHLNCVLAICIMRVLRWQVELEVLWTFYLSIFLSLLSYSITLTYFVIYFSVVIPFVNSVILVSWIVMNCTDIWGEFTCFVIFVMLMVDIYITRACMICKNISKRNITYVKRVNASWCPWLLRSELRLTWKVYLIFFQCDVCDLIYYY